MLNKLVFRSVFYNTRRPTSKPHSDNRDAFEYSQKFQSHEDCRLRLRFYSIWSKYMLASWGFIFFVFYSLLRRSKINKELFEINYMNQQPVKDYEPEDYDYKFWELVRTKKTERGELLINTQSATAEKYVILYLAQTSDSGMKMQRFARLQNFILLRKSVPICSVFVGMDEELDPDVLDEYVEQYSKDVVAAYPLDQKVRMGLKDVFMNIGCIYLLERSTGNVLCIIDPEKHPLEAIGTKFIYTISKNMDFRISQEVIKKELNFKSGKEEELAGKIPLY